MGNFRITFTLNELVAEMNRSADGILRTNFGITYSQFLFLVTLQGMGETNPTSLATELGVSRSAVSQRLEWFETRSLVRVTHPYPNSKQLLLTLTSEGDTLATATADHLEQAFRVVFEPFSEVDLKSLNNQLEAVKRHFLSALTESQ